MSALALQKALREVLTSAERVTELVPAGHIVDRHRLPPLSPSIVLGDDVARPSDGLARDRREHFHDLHVWQAEGATVGVKLIVRAIGDAILLAAPPVMEGGLHLIDWHVWRVRVLRDPEAETAHAVVTIRALIGGAA